MYYPPAYTKRCFLKDRIGSAGTLGDDHLEGLPFADKHVAIGDIGGEVELHLQQGLGDNTGDFPHSSITVVQVVAYLDASRLEFGVGTTDHPAIAVNFASEGPGHWYGAFRGEGVASDTAVCLREGGCLSGDCPEHRAFVVVERFIDHRRKKK